MTYDLANPHDRASLARVADAPVLSAEERDHLTNSLLHLTGSAAASVRMRLGYSASAASAAAALAENGA